MMMMTWALRSEIDSLVNMLELVIFNVISLASWSKRPGLSVSHHWTYNTTNHVGQTIIDSLSSSPNLNQRLRTCDLDAKKQKTS